MEQLVQHLISYGIDPDKAKLAAAALLLQRPPISDATPLSDAMGRAAPKGLNGIADASANNEPGWAPGTHERMTNTALAGYAKMLGDRMVNPSTPADLDLYRSHNGLSPVQTVQPDVMKMFNQTMGLQ